MSDIPFDLTQRATYGHFTPVTIRYSDQDAMGHVNNVVLAQYVEAARALMIQSVIDRFDHPGLDFVLARVIIDYRAELHYPGTVEVGGRFVRLGSKSLTSGYGIFLGDKCVATAESINVFFDINTRKSTTPPDDVRRAIEAEIAGTA